MSDTFWIVLYTHRHGTDVGLMWQEAEPTEEEMIATLDGAWEGQDPLHPEEDYRDDERVEAYGPYHVERQAPEGRLQVSVHVLRGVADDVQVTDAQGHPVEFNLEMNDEDIREIEDD
jgi:hypothetical protein